MKPVEMENLAKMVRKVLDEAADDIPPVPAEPDVIDRSD